MGDRLRGNGNLDKNQMRMDGEMDLHFASLPCILH